MPTYTNLRYTDIYIDGKTITATPEWSGEHKTSMQMHGIVMQDVCNTRGFRPPIIAIEFYFPTRTFKLHLEFESEVSDALKWLRGEQLSLPRPNDRGGRNVQGEGGDWWDRQS